MTVQRLSPWIFVPALLGLALTVAPLAGLMTQVSPDALAALFTDPAAAAALRLSLIVSLAALVISTALGVPLAMVLAADRLPRPRVWRALAVLPMVLPPVVGGVALLGLFGRRGLIGGALDSAFGISLPFTTAGAVLAAVFVAMPFLVVTVEGGLRQLDPGVEQAAATLGARAWTIWWRITVPRLWPALASGLVLCWARALGEFGATITFAGNLSGRTQTMPLAVFVLLQSQPQAAYALSVVLLAISFVVLIALRDRYLGGG